MITELFIEGRRLDISADISSLLTFAIDDIKDFASRQTTFSKTIVLPGTTNNNALFGNIFDPGQANSYNPAVENIEYNFNASKSARCVIFQDFMQTFKGTMRLLQINRDRGLIDYEVALNGELTSLNVSLSSNFLETLDFSAYNHEYNETNILSSWDNAGGSGYYYPLIDYGNYSALKKDWLLGTFRPALYVKEYIDKMFAASNFRYECDLFNTTRFKKLIVPHNRKDLRYASTNIATVSGIVNSPFLLSESAPPTPVEFDVFDSSAFSSTGDYLFTYTDTPTVTLSLAWLLSGTYRLENIGDENDTVMYIRKNGVEIPGTRLTLPPEFTYQAFTWEGTVDITFVTGDTIEFVFVEPPLTGAANSAIIVDDAGFSITSSVPILVPVILGDTVVINDILPKNIRQVDFLTSIVKLFNLYVYEDRFDERLIKISPYVDYYSTDSGNAVDWTYKLNRNAPIKIKPLSELNSKTYNFKYKEDSDYWNDLYKKRYNQGYGSYIFDSQFEFTSQENSLELIFAATPLVGYTSEDKVYSTIFKKTNSGEEQVDSVIRILQTKKITGVTDWSIKNGVTTLTTIDYYGYAGHLDDPDDPSNDLNFGVLRELFFTLLTGDLTKTQFNIYWSSYMAEIADKDSKMFIGRFYLTPKDIFDLDFSKYVHVDGVLWRLNKITDYNVSSPSDCEVELLKVINTIY